MTQITETDETDTKNVSHTPTTPSVDVEALTDAIAEAELAQEEAESKFKAAGVAGELDDMMAAADANKVAIKAVAKAKTVYASATYELRNEERMAMSVELKTGIGHIFSVGFVGFRNLSHLSFRPASGLFVEPT